jgi:hypothetical protein
VWKQPRRSVRRSTRDIEPHTDRDAGGRDAHADADPDACRRDADTDADRNADRRDADADTDRNTGVRDAYSDAHSHADADAGSHRPRTVVPHVHRARRAERAKRFGH